MQIFKFKIPYLLTEINRSEENQKRIAAAVAKLLEVKADNVLLTFAETFLRRAQQAGVLVSVAVADLQASAASYASKITQEKLETEMLSVGLSTGQLVSITGSHIMLLQ